MGRTAKWLLPPRDTDVKVGAVNLYFSAYRTHLDRAWEILDNSTCMCPALRRMCIEIIQNFGPHGEDYLENLVRIATLHGLHDPMKLFMLGFDGYKEPRNKMTAMGMAYVQYMNATPIERHKAFRSHPTFQYESFAAVICQDYDALVVDPPIIEDSEDSNSQDGYFLSGPEWPY